MRLKAGVALWFGIGVLAFGCKNNRTEAPSQQSAAASADSPTANPATAAMPDMKAEYAKALAIAPAFAAMTDQQLATANQKDGIGLGLKMPVTSFKLGESAMLHIVYENVGATKPIAAGMCNAVFVNLEDADRGTVTLAQYRTPPCKKDTFFQNDIPLTKGEVRSMDLDMKKLSIYPIDRGRYLVNVSWQSYVTGKETFLYGPVYSSIGSNGVPIVVR